MTVSKENFYIGFSLSNSSNYDSSIAVLDRFNHIVLLDKYYFTQDMEMFFQNSPYCASSVICVSVPYDNSMLDGKWRIHSKNYKMLGDKFEINRNNWTKRLSSRFCDQLLNFKEEGLNIFRCEINQLRQAFHLAPDFQARTSLDCKGLQNSLKLKYDFKELPDNMLPASSLEAIVCAMFAREIANKNETKELYEFRGLKVLTKPI